MAKLNDRHSRESSYREKILEHAFIGEVLRELWRRGRRAEVLQADVDDAGYDVVFECGSVIRHVQLKASYAGARTAWVPVHMRLADKPAGCVVWMIVEEDMLAFASFRWHGSGPAEPVRFQGLRVAKHTRGDAAGVKRERAAIRQLPKSKFEALPTISDVVDRLFKLESNKA